MGRLARFIRFYTEEDEGGDVGPTSIVSGIPPLRLLNALAKPIKKLLQHGKLSVSGTDVICNNGTLTVVDGQIVADGTPEQIVVQGKNLFAPQLWFETGYEETKNGVTLKVLADGGMQISGTNSSSSSSDFYVCGVAYGRYFIVPAGDYTISAEGVNSNTQVILSGSGNNGFPYSDMRNTQTFPASVTGTVSDGTKSFSYIIVRVPAGGTADTVVRVQLEAGSTASDWVPYHHQTATAENLFAVEDIEDTQDIITGKVIRRTEAVVSDGTTPSGRYVGTVGEGNIIVKALETGYSGDIVEFETEEETPLTVKVDLEPQQDLHGYDSPWPPGGGKNLFPYPNAKDETYSGIHFVSDGKGKITVTGTATGNTACTFNLFNSFTIPDGQQYKVCFLNTQASGAVIFKNGTEEVDSWGLSQVNRAANYNVMSGKLCDSILVSVSSGSVMNLTLQIMFVANADVTTTYIPFSNECPISGWTGTDIARTGKNLVQSVDISRTNSQVTFTRNSDGSVTVTGTASGSAWWHSGTRKANWTFLKAGQYRLTGGISSSKVLYLIGVYADGPNIANSNVTGGVYDRGNGLTFTLTQDAYITYQIQIVNGTETDDTFYPMICLDTSAVATDFVAYAGNTYQISFPDSAGTVYGGTLTVNRDGSKKIDIGKEPLVFDNSSWDFSSNFFYKFFTQINGKAVSDYYITENGVKIYVNGNNGQVRIYLGDNPSMTSETDVGALLNGYKLLYELRQAEEVSVPDTQVITALDGNNVMWSDGTIHVYVPDGEVIEQVTPQRLSTAEGDNTITVTAEVEDIVFDVEYRTEE